MIHNCSVYVESSCKVLFRFVHTFQLSKVLVCLVIKYVFLLLVTVYCVLGQTKTVLSFSMYFFLNYYTQVDLPPLLHVSSEHRICGWVVRGGESL